ncbi:unnamed protein product, partial [Rangifer tarandus platyrhynchus]
APSCLGPRGQEQAPNRRSPLPARPANPCGLGALSAGSGFPEGQCQDRRLSGENTQLATPRNITTGMQRQAQPGKSSCYDGTLGTRGRLMFRFSPPHFLYSETPGQKALEPRARL